MFLKDLSYFVLQRLQETTWLLMQNRFPGVICNSVTSLGFLPPIPPEGGLNQTLVKAPLGRFEGEKLLKNSLLCSGLKKIV